MKKPVAVYVHIPFCPSKCGYCDFNIYAMDGDIIERATRAIITEIERSPHRSRPAKSIFFGGGTPTFLPSEQLAAVLQAVMAAHPPTTGCEITSEANPGTVDSEKFESMSAAGFNRVSIGAQSFDSSELRVLNRVHSADEIPLAVNRAKGAGFDNINIDLMFALPQQPMGMWKENLRRAIELQTQHISLYCLTIEPNTAYYKLHLRGQLDLPDDEAQTRMYDVALEEAAKAGISQYEISNFARPGYECKHNLEYWHNEEYVAYGPGAVERVGDARWTHIKHPRGYCEAVEQKLDLACERESLSPQTHEHERIMLGLRLNDGLDVTQSMNPAAIASLETKGWLARNNGRIALTPKGRHYCNEAIVALI